MSGESTYTDHRRRVVTEPSSRRIKRNRERLKLTDYQTDNPPTPSIKTFQPKPDSPSELDAEPALGHANQCITSVGKSDDVNKSPEARKGKEPAKGAIHDNKESGLGEAST